MKKILILNGGPRPRGNTMELIRQFTRGAEEAGHQVRRFDLQTMRIKGCIGCTAGGQDPMCPCVQNDDMNLIYPEFIAGDVIVFASPLYFWGFTGQLKLALDRLFAISETDGNAEIAPKACVLLVAAGDGSDWNFAPLRGMYENMLTYLKWSSLGEVMAGDVLHVGDIAGKPVLQEAFLLGNSIR